MLYWQATLWQFMRYTQRYTVGIYKMIYRKNICKLYMPNRGYPFGEGYGMILPRGVEDMFTLATNEKIGQYLMMHIEERFKSHREFGREYLRDVGEETGKEQLQKMSNRLSQILKGKKEIQLYDIPVFCRLLDVSCEDILSAGKSHAPTSGRLTNYAIAFSQDKHEWETYVTRKDSPVLNADEYGKTIIDYALEAENYDLLKYLMDKKYIWFVSGDEKDYFVNFGAGTSLEKNNFPYPRNLNVLDVQLKMRDELRTHMIA